MTDGMPPGPRHRSIPAADLPPGAVRRVGEWAVANRGSAAGGDDVRAVSARCRHQLADLSGGSLDAAGCLVCPWHGARYDLASGEMVAGPRGFLFYRGPTPGYSALVRSYARVLRLRRGRVLRDGRRWVVGR